LVYARKENVPKIAVQPRARLLKGFAEDVIVFRTNHAQAQCQISLTGRQRIVGAQAVFLSNAINILENGELFLRTPAAARERAMKADATKM
jgi:hypothetical protein